MRKRLKTLLIKTRRQVFSEMVGNNPSMFHGEGYDFSELREYQIGDDVRKIDWTITAKLQKPYVKLFHEERELHIVAACLLGGSLHFGTHRLKQEVVVEIAAILGYSAVKNGDRFSGALLDRNGVELFRPTKRIFGVNRFIERLDVEGLIGRASDFNETLYALFKRLKRRSIVFVVGDFLEPVDLSLLAGRHEVVAVIVRDRFEEDPLPLGQVQLVDPENSQTLQTYFGVRSAAVYKARRLEADRAMLAHLHRHRIRFVKIRTDEEPFGRLVKLFGGRV